MLEQEIFITALNYSDPAERSQFLDDVCRSDAVLRQRLDELLSCHQSRDSVLDRPPAELVVSLEVRDEMPDGTHEAARAAVLQQLQPFLQPPSQADSLGRLGHYELLQVLGQGGVRHRLQGV